MLKKLILSASAVAIIATSFSLKAKTPQSTSGKIAASILQTVNHRPGCQLF